LRVFQQPANDNSGINGCRKSWRNYHGLLHWFGICSSVSSAEISDHFYHCPDRKLIADGDVAKNSGEKGVVTWECGPALAADNIHREMVMMHLIDPGNGATTSGQYTLFYWYNIQ
jgi:hypothetical protein